MYRINEQGSSCYRELISVNITQKCLLTTILEHGNKQYIYRQGMHIAFKTNNQMTSLPIFIRAEYSDSIEFFIIRIVIVLIGVCINISLLVFLRNNRIGSSKSTLLVRLQTILDTITLLAVLVALFTNPNAIPLKVYWLYWIYCSVLHNNYIFWTSALYSSYIIVLTSFDRLIVVAYPFKYRDMKMSYYRAGIVITFLLAFLVTLQAFFQLTVETSANQTYYCQFQWEKPSYSPFWSAYSYIWLACGTFIPITILIVVYTKIILCLQDTKKAVENDKSQQNKQNLSRRFTLASLIICVFYVLTYLSDSIIYMMNMIGVLRFSDANRYYYYCNFSLGFNCLINSFIYMILIRNYRAFLLAKLCFFKKSTDKIMRVTEATSSPEDECG